MQWCGINLKAWIMSPKTDCFNDKAIGCDDARESELLIFRWVSSGQMSPSQKLLNALQKSTVLWNVRDVHYVLCFSLDALSDLKQVTLLFCTCFTYSDYISVLYVLIILCAGTISWNICEWPQCSMPIFYLEHMEATTVLIITVLQR